MIDLVVAIAWIAMSVVGMRGLKILSRATAIEDAEAELSAGFGDAHQEILARRGGLRLRYERS